VSRGEICESARRCSVEYGYFRLLDNYYSRELAVGLFLSLFFALFGGHGAIDTPGGPIVQAAPHGSVLAGVNDPLTG